MCVCVRACTECVPDTVEVRRVLGPLELESQTTVRHLWALGLGWVLCKISSALNSQAVFPAPLFLLGILFLKSGDIDQ